MVREIFFIVALGMTTLAGCNNSSQPSAPSSTSSADSSPSSPATVTSVPTVEPVAPKPKWASVFLTCLGLMGQSKDKVVAEFGAPDSTFGMMNRYDYDRKFKDDNFALFLFFGEKNNKVELVQMNLEDKPSAGEAWEALAGSGSEPLYFQAHNKSMENYWRGRETNAPREDANMLLAVDGTVQGQKIQLNGRIAEPPFKAETTFDTKTDSYVVGKLVPNPSSTWRDAKIFQIQTGEHDTGFFGEIYGHKHMIAGEVEDDIRPPSSASIGVDIVGLWQGELSGVKGDLLVQRRDKNVFYGIYTDYGSKDTTKISIKGTLADDNVVSFKDTKVLSPANSKWALGVNTGKFEDGNQSMSGVGKDTSGTMYTWKFTKKK